MFKNIIDFLLSIGIDISIREVVRTVEFILCFSACISGFLSCCIVTGSNYLFGKKYGKFHVFRAIIKYLLISVSILLWLALIGFFVVDFVRNFFTIAKYLGYTLKYIVMMFLAMVVFIPLSWFLGSMFGTSNQKKVDKKYMNEINSILMDNPIFVSVLKKLQNDTKIKMVKIFRDGISFHNTVDLPLEKETVVIKGFASTKSEAANLVKQKKREAILNEGSVTRQRCNDIVTFSSFGFDDSESAMYDLSKWLCHYLEPRFNSLCHTKIWNYNNTIYSGPTHYITSNGVTTPAGSSSESINKTESAVICEVLYVEESTPFVEQKPLKKW